MLSHIVAAAKNNVIGRDGDLPWSLPEDMKFFREKTSGHAMIMGRKTFESVGHPLPNRLNVVVTRNTDYQPEGAVVFQSIEKAIEHCQTQTDKWGEEIFIIGGGEIFKETLSLVDRIYLTRIHEEIDGDSLYPDLNLDDFEEVEGRDRSTPVPFSFFTYMRKTN